MKNILITTDFSRHSDHTIHCVLNLFHDSKVPCKILLLNTYLVQQTDPLQVITENDELKKRSKSGLEKQSADLLNKITNANITIATASHIGSLNNVILQFLRKEKIDLVAIGEDDGKHVRAISALLRLQQCPLLITHSV